MECTMTGEMEAIESFWYVQPSWRGGPGGIKLIRAFEEARKRGCKRLKMAYLYSVNASMMDSLYRRMDFEPLQKNFVKELT